MAEVDLERVVQGGRETMSSSPAKDAEKKAEEEAAKTPEDKETARPEEDKEAEAQAPGDAAAPAAGAPGGGQDEEEEEEDDPLVIDESKVSEAANSSVLGGETEKTEQVRDCLQRCNIFRYCILNQIPDLGCFCH